MSGEFLNLPPASNLRPDSARSTLWRNRHTIASVYIHMHAHMHTPLVLCKQLHGGQSQLCGEVGMVQGLL